MKELEKEPTPTTPAEASAVAATPAAPDFNPTPEEIAEMAEHEDADGRVADHEDTVEAEAQTCAPPPTQESCMVETYEPEIPPDEDACGMCGGTGQVMSNETEDAVPCPDCSEPEPEPEPPVPEPPKGPGPVPEFTLDLSALASFLDALRATTDEVKLTIDASGWHVQAVDPAHVMMVVVDLPFERFTDYRLVDEENRTLMSGTEWGLDLDMMKDALEGAGKKGEVKLAFLRPASASERLIVTVGGMTRKSHFVDTAGMSDPKVPLLKWPARIAIPGKTLVDFVKKAGKVSDHIAITVSDEKVNLLAEGDVDSVNLDLEAGTSGVEYVTAVKETVRSLFPLDYVEKVAKALKGCRLELSVGQDYPLRVDWDGPATKGTFLVAPRIESE